MPSLRAVHIRSARAATAGACAIMLLATAAGAHAQRPISASLLRRLAETADAARTGDSIWIAVHLDFPHDVIGVFDNPEVAGGALAGVRNADVFGPYLTPRDPGFGGGYVSPCPHDGWMTMAFTADGICPDGIPISDISRLTLVIERISGEPVRIDMPADRVDAMVFNMTAFDKFFVPYYTRLYGAEFAAQLRGRMARGMRPRSP